MVYFNLCLIINFFYTIDSSLNYLGLYSNIKY